MWLLGVPFFLIGLSTDNIAYMGLGISLGVIFYFADQKKKKKEKN